jgi:hypothetical protein
MDALVADRAQKAMEGANFVAWSEYLEIAHEHGLLHRELRPADVHYPLTTTVFGFFAADPMLPSELDRRLEEKANYLAATLRRAFEPPRPTAGRHLEAAAGKVIAIYERLAKEFRALTYGARHQ